MKTRKLEFFAKYGNSHMVQQVIDSPDKYFYQNSPSLARNPHMTDEQLHTIIRGDESRRVREAAMENPRFNEKHIEQMLTDGGGDHYERVDLVGHPKITLDQSRRILHDPHELSHVKRNLLTLTKHKELLHDAADMNQHDFDWSAAVGILRNTNIDKEIHDKLMKHGDGMVRFTAMKHPLATVADIQHYIDTENPDDTEDDSFAVAREQLEKKKLEAGKEAARTELRSKGLMK